ncbi:hypothetical protein T440DRAFT_155456 [Plenodomus tracheiphilus IPT5]|uniref:Uncharacterized protein n=1 Tax=Plenodomus tracheiphilus IPT5 TaxID=1408161 RepID=A0A6A7BJ23_9PLEO|nr:hypothetical protein T440DRAFT_155456 [Plenodomus tracheiphilus IPT5]
MGRFDDIGKLFVLHVGLFTAWISLEIKIVRNTASFVVHCGALEDGVLPWFALPGESHSSRKETARWCVTGSMDTWRITINPIARVYTSQKTAINCSVHITTDASYARTSKEDSTHLLSHQIPPDMTVVMMFDLIIAFTVLTAVILVALLLYFYLHYLKRRKAQQSANQSVEETGQHSSHAEGLPRCLSRRLSRQQLPQERDIEQQRMSMKTPPPQLLPEIETSDDRAVEWLEKGKCKEVRFEEIGIEHPAKSYQLLGVKGDGDLRWDWSSRQMQRPGIVPQNQTPRLGTVKGSN